MQSYNEEKMQAYKKYQVDNPVKTILVPVSFALNLGAAVGVLLVVSGVYAPFGVSILGAAYLAGTLSLPFAALVGYLAYSKNTKYREDIESFNVFNPKKDYSAFAPDIEIWRERTIKLIVAFLGYYIGSFVGAILTATGSFMAAPAILPAIGISLAFGVISCVFGYRVVGKAVAAVTKQPAKVDDCDELGEEVVLVPSDTEHSSCYEQNLFPHLLIRSRRASGQQNSLSISNDTDDSPAPSSTL